MVSNRSNKPSPLLRPTTEIALRPRSHAPRRFFFSKTEVVGLVVAEPLQRLLASVDHARWATKQGHGLRRGIKEALLDHLGRNEPYRIRPLLALRSTIDGVMDREARVAVARIQLLPQQNV